VGKKTLLKSYLHIENRRGFMSKLAAAAAAAVNLNMFIMQLLL
jgi:hypothetical protein